MFDALCKAIQEGRAYLDTFAGRYIINGYNERTGWALGGNSPSSWDQRSFMVCADRIRIAPEPIRRERRVLKRSSFEFQGRTIQVLSDEIEVSYMWGDEPCV